MIVAAVAAFLVLVLAAGVVQMRSNASWDAMLGTVAELEGARTRIEYRRRPLWGTETTEPALRHYDEAVILAQELGEDADAELMAVMRQGGRATHPTSAARARWQPVLLALRRGAHAVDAARVLTVGYDSGTGMPDLPACRRVAFAAVIEARSLRQAGQGTGAVQTTLDAATFGNDLAQRGTLTQQLAGNALTSIATTEAWNPRALLELDTEALDVLAAGLTRLDQRMPTRSSFGEDMIQLARHFERAEGDPDIRAMSAWRYGFSVRWMFSDAFHHINALLDRLQRPRGPWPERRAAMEHEFAGIARWPNKFARTMCPSLIGADRQLREVLAEVRMLRLAIELHRGRKLPPLDDPLGHGPLLVEEIPNGYRIRSVGTRSGRPIEREVKLLVLPGTAPK